MANIPITSLPIALVVTAGDDVPIVQAGTTKRTTVGAIAAFTASSTTVNPTIVTDPGDYTVLVSNQFVYLTGPHTRNVFLPPCVDMVGHLLWIKVDANGVTNSQTIMPDGTDTIEGLSSLVLDGAYQWVLLYAVSDDLWLLMT